MTEANDVLLLGLSKTGKSTFVAALYGSIKSRTTQCTLALDVLDDDREYLENLSRLWANATEIDRTSPTVQVRLSLLDKRNDPPSSLFLSIPDMSGETFREQFESRQWTLGFEETYAGAERVLLFVHAERMEEPATLYDLQHARMGLDNAVLDGSSKAHTEKVQEWQIKSCRTQVKIVDLLQFLARARPLTKPRRLALIVSAWDLLQGTPQVSPRAWLEMTMGLLAQYITANPTQYEVEVFGVSAQGFDYEKDNAVERLAEVTKPAERVRVTRGSSTDEKHDITEPIQWLLDPDTIE